MRFADLPAQGYSGIVRYRWKRGKRTVLSGLIRTRKARVAGKKGKAFCSLRVGRRPVDTTAPFIAPIPSDSHGTAGLWPSASSSSTTSRASPSSSRASTAARSCAGGTTTIEGEGVTLLEYAARDAAGNQTPVKTTTLRVDENPPTAPVCDGAHGLDERQHPGGQVERVERQRIRRGGIHRRSCATRAARSPGRATCRRARRRAISVTDPLPPGNYTAEVVAYDGAVPQPFTATGTRGFTVVPPPTGRAAAAAGRRRRRRARRERQLPRRLERGPGEQRRRRPGRRVRRGRRQRRHQRRTRTTCPIRADGRRPMRPPGLTPTAVQGCPPRAGPR